MKLTKTLFVALLGGVINIVIIVLVIISVLVAKPEMEDLSGVIPLSSIPGFENSGLIDEIDNLTEYGNLPVTLEPGTMGRSNPFAVLKLKAE